jgi:hypothetical protein
MRSRSARAAGGPGLALRGQAEELQRVGIQRQLDRVVALAPALVLGEVEVGAVPVAHVLLVFGHVVLEHAVVLGVHLPLLGVGLAAQVLGAVLAAPAHQEADAGLRLEVDDEVGVVLELARAALGVVKAGNFRREASSISTSWNGLQSPAAPPRARAPNPPDRRTRRSAGPACS